LGRKIGVYRLCVRKGKKGTCRRFKGKGSGSTINWSKKFPYKGTGHYTVDWLAANGSRKLGRSREFNWGACAPANLSMKGVWKPHRLIVVDRCYTGKYIVQNSFRFRTDRDYHVNVNPIGGTRSTKNIEIIPRDQPRHLPRPANGRRIEAEGVFVCDTFHGPFGHTEMHPFFRESYLDEKGQPFRNFYSGPQHKGTPSVNLTPKGRFHCPGVA
jgi:hypothetical protein